MKVVVSLSKNSIKLLNSYLAVLNDDMNLDLRRKPILKDVLNAYVDSLADKQNAVKKIGFRDVI